MKSEIVPADRPVKCLRNYMTAPHPGFASPEPVRVLRRASEDLPEGYYIVRFLNDPPWRNSRIAMHVSHIGAEIAS
jgi:hypothetical protein